MEQKKMVSVRNRNNGITTYQLPDMHIVRQFGEGETKKIPFEEIQALQYAPGGDYMLKELLVVEDDEALNELNMNVEPEYFYDKDRVKQLLLTGTIDEFADFLDFAPEGAIEMVKQIAVEEQVPDTRKRKMISEKTGFNIDNAIMINDVMNADAPAEEKQGEKKERRVPVADTAVKEPTRRAATPQYKVISKG